MKGLGAVSETKAGLLARFQVARVHSVNLFMKTSNFSLPYNSNCSILSFIVFFFLSLFL